jgi:hypothetical protein
MNDEARAELDRILALEPQALTEADQAFLMARRGYLSEEQQKVYGVSDSEEPKAKKSKSVDE